MARDEYLVLLRHDVVAWNDWRQKHPDIRPDLSGADLEGADLALADLSRAVLRGANLMLANLRGADLRAADLSGVNFIGARLMGADLAGANLSGANLSTAEDLIWEEMEETAGDDRTILPDGVDRPAHWRAARLEDR